MSPNPPAILYIEDSPASQKVMRILICDVMGYEQFALLENTNCLIENVTAFGVTFDVIFLDLDIQPMDGYEACQLLKADPRLKNTRIIALTAAAVAKELLKMQAVGFDGALGKPISYIDFPEKLLSILNGESVWETE